MTAEPAPASTPAAARTSSVLVRVRGALSSLSPAERRVAEVALADPAGTAQLSIGALAVACRASEATVIRFCRTVGLTGYPELRLALAAEAGRGDGTARIIGSDIGPADDLSAVVEKVCFADARAIEDTAEQLDLEALAAVVDAVVDAGQVDLYGIGASGFVAADLEQKLRRIRRPAFASRDGHAALTSAALLGPGDVAIGFSHTGSTHDTVDPLVEANRRGARTVAITNAPRSPLATAAELVLTTAARETTFRSGAMASRLAQLSVVDCLFVAVAQRTYSDTLEALERTYGAVRDRHGDGRRR
ncbi:MAG: MurR/RpiR family transcriptional regulator [Euzebyales bacterium]|nr:MurR/RpiR family transcriptional regulator [Euzebyales bacterium]